MENNKLKKIKVKEMIHMKNIKKILKKLVFIIIVIYAIITYFKQKKVLNAYSNQNKDLEAKIAEASEKQEQLNEKKQNVNSAEYIESIARDKLGMYFPNERVYVNNEN